MRVTSNERVVAIVVCHNGRPFIRDTLRGLTRQTRPIDDLIVVDTGSRDGTKDWVREHIGSDSVFSVRGQFGHAVTAALRHPRLAGADWVWLLHDDSCPERDALQHLLDRAAYTRGAAVLGPKLVGWDDLEELREVGWWIDRAAYAVSPIDGYEIDQGQHDHIDEAFYVSTAGMLARPAALQVAGGFDLRMSAFRDDLDLCWRVRLLGGKVLVAPAARVRHFAATSVGSRMSPLTVQRRYLIERHALAALLKTTALRRLPTALLAYFAATVVRLLGLLGTGRFGDVGQVLLAWGWNAKELPATFKLRRRIQRARTVDDRELARLRVPHPGGQRLRSVVRALTELATTATQGGGSHASTLGPKDMLKRLVTRHPVATMVALFALLMAVSLRSELLAPRIGGGDLAAFPASAADTLTGFVSAVGADGLGSTLPASPALAVFGVASVLTFGKGLIAQKLLLWLVLPLAAATCTRALRVVVTDLRARALAGLLYATSPLAFAALAQGRVGELAFLVLAPSILAQVWQALRLMQPREAWRPVLRYALLSALAIAVYPTALVILAGITVLAAAAGVATAPTGHRGDVARRAALLAGGLPAALVLLLPWSLVLFTSASPLAGVGAALTSPTFTELVQLHPGGTGAPWYVGPAYPALALLSVLLAGSLRRLLAFWFALALLGMALLAYWQTLNLPPHFTDWPGGVLVPGAVAWAAVVGIGLSSALPALRRVKGVVAAAQTAGRRAQRTATRVANVTPLERVGAAAMAAVTAVTGVAVAALLAMGSWPLETGASPLPATVSESDRRVLWLAGHPDGGVRYEVTGPDGQTLLGWARQSPAEARDALGQVVGNIVQARTHRGGELLRSFNIGWVVVRKGPLADQLVEQLARQGDLASRVTDQAALFEGPPPAPAGMILAQAPPTTADLLTAEAGPSALHGDLPGVAGRVERPGVVVLPMPADEAWQASAGGQVLQPAAAFGWAQAFTLPEGARGDLVVSYSGQRNRDLALMAELILVLAMLATLARPTSRPAPLVPVSDEDTGELRLPAAVVGSYQ